LIYEILAVVVSIAIVVLVIYLIPTISQIKRTAGSIERFFNSISDDLRPLLADLRETATQANKISSVAREGVDKINIFLEAVGDIGRTIRSANSVIRGSSGSVLIYLAALGVGIRKGLKVFINGLLRGGDNNGRR